MIADEPTPRPRYVPALDGIRGIGLIGMLAYHAQAPWAKGAIFTISMFFTMSGFLITTLMIHERSSSGRVDLRAFWTRRFRRLLPGALVTLGLVVVFGLVVADQTQLANLRGDVVAALVYVANWRFVLSGTAYLNAVSSPSPVLHFWSLAIEEQFYLLFPLLVIVLVGRRSGRRARADTSAVRLRLGVGAAVLLVVSTALPFVFSLSHDRIYLGSDTRAPEILVGVLLAVLLARQPLGGPPRGTVLPRLLSVLGPVVLVVMVWSWIVVDKDSNWIYRGGLAGYSLLSATLVAAGLMQGNLVARILGVRPLASLGKLSYGIYLYHWPIYLWLTPQRLGWDVNPLHPGWSFWGLLTLRVALTLAVAVASYRFIEEPLRLGRPLLRVPLKRLGPAFASVIVVAVLAATIGVDGGTVSVAAEQNQIRMVVGDDVDHSSPIPHSLSGAAAPTTTAMTPPTTVPTSTSTSTSWETVPGGLKPKPVVRPKRRIRMLIVGDSSAVFLAYALNSWNDKAKVFDMSSYALMGCPIGRGGTEFSTAREKSFAPECATWATEWARAVQETKPDLIMVASGYHDATDRRLTPGGPWEHPGQPHYDRFLMGEYNALVDVLSAAGAPILWLDNPPVREGQNLANGEILNDPANDPARMELLNQMLRRLAVDRPNVHVVDYARFFWTWPGGPFDPKLRLDGLHVDYDGRAIVGRWLGPELLDAYWHAVLPAAPAGVGT